MRIKSFATAQAFPRYASCASIKDFGAVGNGTANDAVALQKAINKVGSGCSIFFPPGVYRLSSNVTINKDIIFQLGPQVEVRQLARLIPSTNAAWSLTIQGEGPGTSVWRPGVNHPFWSGTNGGPRFKNLRLINLEFRSIGTAGNTCVFGGSTDLLEISFVTISRGDATSDFGIRTGDGALTTAARNVLRDINVVGGGTKLAIECQDAALVHVERLTGDFDPFLGPSAFNFLRSGTGSMQVLISSCRITLGSISRSNVAPVIKVQTSGSGVLTVTINDVEILTNSWDGALLATTANTSSMNLLVNSLRFTVTVGSGGYAARILDSSSSVMRAVISASFFRATSSHSGAAVESTLSNSSSLLTLAGVDQRGWDSLT
jgi:hypothetical protein